VLVAAVLFGVDLGRVVHEAPSVEGVRLSEQGIVCGLGVIAELVPFGGEFVKVGSGPVVFGGLPMSRNCRMSGHGRSLQYPKARSYSPYIVLFHDTLLRSNVLA